MAAQAIVHSFFASSVQLHHHPEAEGDGFKNGPELVAFQRGELQTLTESLEDFRHENVLVTAAGRSMTIDSAMSGTLSDGTHLELGLRMRYSFSDGLVTRVDAFLENSSDTERANLSQALQHGRAAVAGSEDGRDYATES